MWESAISRLKLTRLFLLVFSMAISSQSAAGTLQENQKPVANAGQDQRFGLGQRVELSARDSYDPDGEQLSYHWRQVKGLKIDLLDVNTLAPSFTSPQQLRNDKSFDLVFKLTVSDSHHSRSTDKVVITIARQPCEEPQQLQNGSCVNPLAMLNDTGVTNCDTTNLINQIPPCPVDGHPGQDAEFGRDKTNNDDSNGHAGFSFTKIGSKGQILDNSAKHWNCVKDNVTGLIWEVKTMDGKLRDLRNTYSWYLPDNGKNGGNAGTPNGGKCKGSDCDTNAYQQAVNAKGLCGASDWRLPSVSELLSIVDYATADPAVDKRFFPNTARLTNDLNKVPENWYWYWTSSPSSDSNSYVVMDGNVGEASKAIANSIRLVRNSQ